MAKSAEMKTMGKNIEYRVDGDKLIIEIDMSQDFGASKSGKTIIVASTEGNKSIGTIKLGINAYKYPPRDGDKKKKGKK